MRILLWAVPLSRPSIEASFGGLTGMDVVSVASGEEAIAALPEADVLVIPVFHYTPALAQAARASSRLRFIQLLTIGYDRMLQDRPSPALLVASAGDSLAPAVGEHAVAMILALSRRLHDALANAAVQKWDGSPNSRMFTLEGKTITIVGFGAIGREAAARLRAFGVRIIGVSRTPPTSDLADERIGVDALDGALARSDVVMIATPLTAETRNLFDAARIARIRKGALLVNIARGPVVDTMALTAALESGHLGGAGLDVTDPEPLPADHPLWQAPNLVLTPHISAAGSAERLSQFVAANVAAFARGETPRALIAF